MWDMANDRDYIKIRNKNLRQKRQEKGKREMNTAMCGEALLADLVQSAFFHCLLYTWVWISAAES